jgi:hypothetical protein
LQHETEQQSQLVSSFEKSKKKNASNFEHVVGHPEKVAGKLGILLKKTAGDTPDDDG